MMVDCGVLVLSQKAPFGPAWLSHSSLPSPWLEEFQHIPWGISAHPLLKTFEVGPAFSNSSAWKSSSPNGLHKSGEVTLKMWDPHLTWFNIAFTFLDLTMAWNGDILNKTRKLSMVQHANTASPWLMAWSHPPSFPTACCIYKMKSP